MKIKTHKESSGKILAFQFFPRAANDQTVAPHRESSREKQTGHACPGGKPEADPEADGSKHVRDERDFNNIETRAVIKFYFFLTRQGAEGNSRHSDINISLFTSWSG